MGCGWNNCGCGTIYTDAWGNPVSTGPVDATATTPCAPDWGLLAMGAVVAVAAMAIAGHLHKR
jgi:hypothetical protein